MAEYKVKRARPILGELTVPGDKSISHRSIMLAGLSNGSCRIDGFLPSDDCLATVNAMRSLGVKIDVVDEDEIDPERPTSLIVHGNGMQLSPPKDTIDCGNSGTTMRLLSGILAGQPFESRLTGDESLTSRPMSRIINPLTAMGASIQAEGSGDCAPLLIKGGNLKAIDYELPVASAQVKSAVLLAGLFANGRTTVIEPVKTRNHTETMLEYFLVHPRRNGNAISIDSGQRLESRDFLVPGDVSSAAFWMVAAAAQKGSDLLVRNVGLNPTRTGILGVLLRMGARLRDNLGESPRAEPAGNISLKGVGLKATTVDGDEIPNVIDELPVIAVAGALAEGKTDHQRCGRTPSERDGPDRSSRGEPSRDGCSRKRISRWHGNRGRRSSDGCSTRVLWRSSNRYGLRCSRSLCRWRNHYRWRRVCGHLVSWFWETSRTNFILTLPQHETRTPTCQPTYTG